MFYPAAWHSMVVVYVWMHGSGREMGRLAGPDLTYFSMSDSILRYHVHNASQERFKADIETMAGCDTEEQ